MIQIKFPIQMWADDVICFRELLRAIVEGKFVFDGDEMVYKKVN